MENGATEVPSSHVLHALEEAMTPEGRAKWLAEWNEPGWWEGGRGADIDWMQKSRREEMERNILAAAYVRRRIEERGGRPAKQLSR